LHRVLTGCGHDCVVVAPSLIPVKAGDRVKTDRRDAVMLAKLHRAGELTPIWIPDAAHEAMRDLVRARATAGRVLSKARQHLQSFLLRHDQIYRGVRAWTLAYRHWLTTVRFAHPAQQIVLQDYIHAVHDAEARLDRLTRQIEELLPNWSMAPVVATLQAMRGIALVVAVTVVAEVGDFRRFANARQLMAYLGLVPSEHSSGASVRRGGITKAGNVLARRVLIEGAWTPAFAGAGSTACRHVSAASFMPQREAAAGDPGHRLKGQIRLCSRYRRLAAAGKPKVVVTTAIAREMIRLHLGDRLHRPARTPGLSKPAYSNARRSTPGNPLVRTAGDRTTVGNPPSPL
jgi:transposase